MNVIPPESEPALMFWYSCGEGGVPWTANYTVTGKAHETFSCNHVTRATPRRRRGETDLETTMQLLGSLRPTGFARHGTAALAALGIVLGLLSSPDARAAEQQPLFQEIGTLDRFAADARSALGSQFVPPWNQADGAARNKSGTAIVITQARQLWQIYPAPLAAPRTAILVRDLDTLQIIHSLTVQESFDRATVSHTDGGDWAHAVDDAGKRLFLLESNHHEVYEFDTRSFNYKRWPLPGSQNPFGNPVPVGGLTYDRFEVDLLVLYGGPAAFSVANSNAFLYRLDVSGVPSPAFPVQDVAKIYRLRSCTGPVTSTDLGGDTYNWELLVTQEFLYIPCQRAGHTVVVVRLTRPDGASPNHAEDMVAGPVYGDAVLADPGGGRLFVTTIQREIWAFEAATMAFVGVVATGPQDTREPTGYGLDRASGRLYFQSSTFGIGVAEGRFFPIPQARTRPHFAIGQERIWSDGVTNRVFVLEGEGLTATKPAAYKIYKTGGAPLPPAAPDPDRNTTDVAETEGVTEVRYNASGSGYGSRILWAKGYATVVPGPTVGEVAPTYDVFNAFRSACGYTDRDIFAGRVAKAEYDTGSAAASAIPVEVDSATQQDLNQPSRCINQLEGRGDDSRWAYEAASCATSEGDESKVATGRNGNSPPLGTSRVNCPKPPGGRLEADAQTTLTGMVEVDRSWTKTTIERTTAGVVSTVESVAEGVTLGDFLSIGEIRSKAVSTSNGRPKRDNMSEHEIMISNVVFNNEPQCFAECDLVKLERDLNLLAAGRVVFRTGHGASSGRDESLVAGSAKGAQTAVQKSVARQASDRALIGDFTTEIPAFEMTVFNDNTRWGRARQLYQFAGVASSATYNIVVRPSFAPFDGQEPSLGEQAALGDGGSTPFAGLLMDNGGGGGGRAFETSSMAAERGDDTKQGGLAGVVRALARGIRVFLTSPRTALLLLTAWALLTSPAILTRRRRLLAGIRD